MSISSRLLVVASLFVLAPLAMTTAHAQYSDPSARVARVSHSEGRVSYSPAGEDDWLGLMLNRPLVRGDRLWTGRNARAEIQVGSAAVRLGPESGFEILELNDDFAQLLLSEGTLNLSIRRLQRGQSFEVATPNLAFNFDRPGRIRIDVDPQRNETTVVVREGEGEVFGDGTSFALRAGDTIRFYGDDLRDYQAFNLPREDNFDRYSASRDRLLERSVSLRYVDDDLVGYASLDAYGSWQSVRGYGNVWYPDQVEQDWAPYRDGRWVWQEPWGWTWVDEAPWGFAPSHYGRWAHISNRWGWIPGPRNVRSFYAPALVAFVGGSRWSLTISSGGSAPIGWFPLGPRDVYVPSYHSSRDYFSRVNNNNTVINNTSITNVYNNYSSGTINVNQVNYANRGVIGAVTAVPGDVFVNARSVRQEAIRLDRNALGNAEYFRVAAVVPSQRSVLGAANAAAIKPARGTFDRRVVARTEPPAAPRPFTVRAEQLRKTPGRAPRAATVSEQSQPAKAEGNVRVIGDTRRTVDAREVNPRRGGTRVDDATGRLQPLDRSAQARPDPVSESGRGEKPGQTANKTPRGGRNAATGDQPSREQAAPQRSDSRQQAQGQREQEMTDRQRQADQRADQQRGRKDDAAQQQQREIQAAEGQRQDDARIQQAQAQRDANARQQQRDEQATERQRQTDLRATQEANRNADAAQRQLDKEKANDRQRANDARVEQERNQRDAETQRLQREQNATERQRQADAGAQEQAQRETNARNQQSEQQAAEQQRQADVQSQRQQAQRERSERNAAQQPAPAVPEQSEPARERGRRPKAQEDESTDQRSDNDADSDRDDVGKDRKDKRKDRDGR